MDINPFTTIERSTEMVWSSEDQSLGHPKSYTCSFCKRGFSNAQALGGHMNIHRRDRARLKEYSDETPLSMDATKKISDEQPLVQLEPSEEKSLSSKRPWTSTFSDAEVASSGGRDGGGGLRQLPLFAETPRATDDLDESSGGGHAEKGMQCLSHGSSQTELDLELRLGLEPHEASTGNTKEFF